MDVEAFVVDDGSTDDTSQFLTELNSPRVRWVRHEVSRGLPAARNAGLAHVSSPWVAFLDDDDLWAPEKLRAQLQAAQADGGSWAASDAVLIDYRFEVLGVHPAPHGLDIEFAILRRNVIPGGGSNVLARTELIRAVGGFDASNFSASLEDWDLWIRLARASRLVTVARADVGYFLHQGSMSRNIGRMASGRDAILRKYASDYRDAGVEFDYAWWDSYILGLELASGRRLAAARAKVKIFDTSHALQSFAGLLAVLVSPKAVERRQQLRQVRAYPPSLLADADAWLSSYRTNAASMRSRSRTTDKRLANRIKPGTRG